MNAFTLTPSIFASRLFLAVCCLVTLAGPPVFAIPTPTFDSAGKPVSVEEDIGKSAEESIWKMVSSLRTGELGHAAALADRLSGVEIDDARIPAVLSFAAAARGDVEEAREQLARAEENGDTPYIRYARAMILRLENRHHEAEQTCRKAIAMDGSHPYPWNILGRIQIDQGKTEAAYSSFRKAVEIEPNFVPGHINLGASAYYLGRQSVAIGHFQRAIRIDPKASHAHYGLGLIYVQTGRYQPASEHFETALQLDPGNIAILEELASAQMQAGQYEKASETGELMKDKGMAEADLILGKAALYLGNPQKAREYFQRSSAVRSKAQSMIGFSHMLQQEYETALKVMKDALRDNPDAYGAHLIHAALKFRLGTTIDLDQDLPTGWGAPLDKAVFFSRGCVQAARGQWESALQDWKGAKNLVPGFSFRGLDTATLSRSLVAEELPHLNLGVVYFYKDLFDPAYEEFSRALEESADSPLSNYWAAQVMLKKGEREKAISHLKAAADRAPKFFTSLYSLAELHFLAGNAQKSVEYYQRALEVKSDPGILLKLGFFYESSNQFSKAESSYRKLIAQSPDFFIGYNQLAWLYAKNEKNLDQALDLAKKADSLRPGNASVLDTLGWIHYHKKDYDTALAYLKQSEEVNPDNPVVLYHIGLTYNALGMSAKALQYLQKSVDMDAGFEGSEKAKAILRSLKDTAESDKEG